MTLVFLKTSSEHPEESLRILTIGVGGAWRRRRRGEGETEVSRREAAEQRSEDFSRRLGAVQWRHLRQRSNTPINPSPTNHGAWKSADPQRFRHHGGEATRAVRMQGQHQICGQILLGFCPPQLLATRHTQELPALHLTRSQDLHVWIRGRDHVCALCHSGGTQ